MAIVRELRTRYANGVEKTYRRVVKDMPNAYTRQKDMDTERERQRISKTKGRIEQRVNSHNNWRYFSTFTTIDESLARDGKRLLDSVSKYLKQHDIRFIAVLEVYTDVNSADYPDFISAFDAKIPRFHVHALTDREVDFNDWTTSYACDKRHLYCEKIHSSVERCYMYMTKDLELTKKKLNTKAHLYLCNTKKKGKQTENILYNDETGEIYSQETHGKLDDVDCTQTSVNLSNTAHSLPGALPSFLNRASDTSDRRGHHSYISQLKKRRLRGRTSECRCTNLPRGFNYLSKT